MADGVNQQRSFPARAMIAIPTLKLGWLPVLVVAPCILLSVAAVASPSGMQTDPRDVVRNLIQHELTEEEQDCSHWMYLMRRSEPGAAEIHEVVETAWGDLDIVLMRNGHQLADAERQKEIDRLKRLAMNPRQ